MKIKTLIIGLAIAVVSVIVIGVVLLSVLVFYYKPFVELAIGKALGATVEMDRIHVDVKNRTLYITNFILHNPEGFAEDEALAYVPRIAAVYDPKSIIVNKKLHFITLDIYVKGLVAIKKKGGKLNVEQLAIFKENFEELPMQTDRLILTADHVVSKDFTKGERLHIEEFDVNIKNQAYEGFPTFEDITAKVVSEMLNRTTIKGAKLLGVAVLFGSVGGWSALIPAEAVVVMSEKGNYEAVFNADYEDVYEASLEAAHELGKNIVEYKNDGIIKGYINDADVTIKIVKKNLSKSNVTVSARKYYFAKLNIAGGVLYEIAQKLMINKKMHGKELLEKLVSIKK